MITETVTAIDEITDKDFKTPNRTVELPATSDKLNSLIPINGRKVVIKQSTFAKNLKEHSELSPELSRKVLNQALYSTDMIVHDKPTSKPNYWILVKVGEHNAIVNIDTDPGKANVEVVGWRWVRGNSLEQIKNRANRDGGQIFMTREGAAGLSALTTESVFRGKGNASLGEKQGAEAKGSASSMAERAVAAGRELVVEVEVVHDASAIEHEDARMQRKLGVEKEQEYHPAHLHICIYAFVHLCSVAVVESHSLPGRCRASGTLCGGGMASVSPYSADAAYGVPSNSRRSAALSTPVARLCQGPGGDRAGVAGCGVCWLGFFL